ncbi:MAG: hypothetical protein II306_07705 [Clostridia bacterium]|nr:hypothetical protein [Clostridia bacterium]
MKINFYSDNNSGEEKCIENVSSIDFYRTKVICYFSKDFKYDMKEIPINNIISIDNMED